jgi:hypothetical protein
METSQRILNKREAYINNNHLVELNVKKLSSLADKKHQRHLLFAYLDYRNSRFIRNTARIIPLTGFLCVYPRSNIANLSRMGKSYGDGTIKVEPHSLEKLSIPDHVIKQLVFPIQMRLLDQ